MKKIITYTTILLTAICSFAQSGEQLVNSWEKGVKFTDAQTATIEAWLTSAKPVVTAQNFKGILAAKGKGGAYISRTATKEFMLANSNELYDSCKRAWAIYNKDADVAKTVNVSRLNSEDAITFLNFYCTEVLTGINAVDKAKEFNKLGDKLGNNADVLSHFNNLLKVLVNKAKVESEIGKL